MIVGFYNKRKQLCKNYQSKNVDKIYEINEIFFHSWFQLNFRKKWPIHANIFVESNHDLTYLVRHELSDCQKELHPT